MLPEQKVVEVKKRSSNKENYCTQKNKKVHGQMGENVLAINNPIMNDFDGRKLTKKVLNKIEEDIKKRWLYCKSRALCVKF